jgi:hypothetical protein
LARPELNKNPIIRLLLWPYQRFGSGDGEREMSMTRQMPFFYQYYLGISAWCWLNGTEDYWQENDPIFATDFLPAHVA